MVRGFANSQVEKNRASVRLGFIIRVRVMVRLGFSIRVRIRVQIWKCLSTPRNPNPNFTNWEVAKEVYVLLMQ